jgi:CIC family chloride channel protein
VNTADIGTVLSRSYLGSSPAFNVPEYTLVSNAELLFYCMLDKSNMLLGVVRQKEAFAYYRKQLTIYGSDQHEGKKA